MVWFFLSVLHRYVALSICFLTQNQPGRKGFQRGRKDGERKGKKEGKKRGREGMFFFSFLWGRFSKGEGGFKPLEEYTPLHTIAFNRFVKCIYSIWTLNITIIGYREYLFIKYWLIGKFPLPRTKNPCTGKSTTKRP